MMYIPVFLPCPECHSGPNIFYVKNKERFNAQCECSKIFVSRKASDFIPDREDMKELAIMWNAFIKVALLIKEKENDFFNAS